VADAGYTQIVNMAKVGKEKEKEKEKLKLWL
jgi:hypothetical protein